LMQAQRQLLQSWREGVSDKEVLLCTRIVQVLNESVQKASFHSGAAGAKDDPKQRETQS
jgi:hypothetical protein